MNVAGQDFRLCVLCCWRLFTVSLRIPVRFFVYTPSLYRFKHRLNQAVESVFDCCITWFYWRSLRKLLWSKRRGLWIFLRAKMKNATVRFIMGEWRICILWIRAKCFPNSYIFNSWKPLAFIVVGYFGLWKPQEQVASWFGRFAGWKGTSFQFFALESQSWCDFKSE